MKFLLLCSIFLTNILFAQYSADKNSGKIDMHGGKSEMLLNNKNSPDFRKSTTNTHNKL